MTIEEMKKHEWIVSWSGGKDSTATIILMHENKIPIKKIIYVRMMYDEELPATLPVMTNFVDNAKKVFESWGYDVEYMYPERTLMDFANNTFKRSKYPERIGQPYGITCLSRGRCKMTMEKQKAIRKGQNSEDYTMIGYASDEIDRIVHIKDSEKKQSIMVELGIKESDTFDICRKYNLLSPLYDLGLTRDGCWFCPNAGKKERKMLKENHPELVKKIYNLIDMCKHDISRFGSLNTWVDDYFKDKERR